MREWSAGYRGYIGPTSHLNISRLPEDVPKARAPLERPNHATVELEIIAQTLGPEALMKFVNADEAIKRLAAAQGIDTLNLVKSMEEMQQEQQQAQQAAMQQSLTDQAGQLAGTPMMDPTKNPEGFAQMQEAVPEMMGQQMAQPPQQ